MFYFVIGGFVDSVKPLVVGMVVELVVGVCGSCIVLAQNFKSVNDLTDSGSLFPKCAKFGVGLAVISMAVVVVMFVVVVLQAARVNVGHASTSVVLVRWLLYVR